MMTLFVKNMVCNRCVTVVTQTLTNLGLHPVEVLLGEVRLQEDQLTADQQKQVDKALASHGFERIDDRKGRLVEAIKNKVITMVHHSDAVDRKFNWSAILADELHYEYNYLSSLFSSLEGVTLEQYIIRQKIERAKELLFYDELNLSQIAAQLGYSSVAHLSAQFKKITGFTPSDLKKARQHEHTRKPLDHI